MGDGIQFVKQKQMVPTEQHTSPVVQIHCLFFCLLCLDESVLKVSNVVAFVWLHEAEQSKILSVVKYRAV